MIEYLLKYMTWLIPVGISFVGAWFYAYTSTDKVTNKKTLTSFGKIAIVFTVLGLILSLYLMIASDQKAYEKSIDDEEKLSIRQQELNQEKQKRQKFQNSSNLKADENIALNKNLLVLFENVKIIIDNRGANLDNEQVNNALSGIAKIASTSEELKNANPLLHAEFEKAITFDDYVVVGEKIIKNNTEARFENNNRVCRNLYDKMDGLDGMETRLLLDDELIVRFHTMPDGSRFTLVSQKFGNPEEKLSEWPTAKFFAVLENGDAIEMQCTTSGTGRCEINLNIGSINANVHTLLQSNNVSAFQIMGQQSKIGEIAVDKNAANLIKAAISCLKR